MTIGTERGRNMRSDLMMRRGRNNRAGNNKDRNGGRSNPTGGVSRSGGDSRFGMASESDARHVLGQSYGTGIAERVADVLPIVQGSYYVATGLWPIVHMASFERVTGRKTDRWLVRTVGALATAIGSGLLLAGRRGYVPPELRTVSQLAAAGFVAIDVPTVLRRRIPPVYLADAAVELIFLAATAWAGSRQEDQADRLDELVREEAIQEFGH